MTQKELLYQTLKEIQKEKSKPSIISDGYYKSLEEIGLIDIQWDTYLTKFGTEMLDTLRRSFEKW